MKGRQEKKKLGEASKKSIFPPSPLFSSENMLYLQLSILQGLPPGAEEAEGGVGCTCRFSWDTLLAADEKEPLWLRGYCPFLLGFSITFSSLC